MWKDRTELRSEFGIPGGSDLEGSENSKEHAVGTTDAQLNMSYFPSGAEAYLNEKNI